MDIERLVALIVKTVVEELVRQGVVRSDGPMEQTPPVDPVIPSPAPVKSARRVISAGMVLDAAGGGKSVLEVPPNALITPLAQDTAREKGIMIRREEPHETW